MGGPQVGKPSERRGKEWDTVLQRGYEAKNGYLLKPRFSGYREGRTRWRGGEVCETAVEIKSAKTALS